MTNYATPSDRFQRQAINQPPPMNFFAPPNTSDYSNSGVDNTTADDTGTLPQDNTPKYYKPAPAESRPGAVAPPGYESLAQPVLNGLQNSSTPATTDTPTQVASVAGNTLAGAASGALTGAAIGAAGGPIGAGTGALIGGGVALLSSGLNAWIGNRQAKAEADRQAAVIADANRIRQQEIARDEKWRVQNRLDSLDAAKEDRRRYNQAQARQNMIDTATRLQAALANNASLRDHWAKYGFN